MIGISLQNQLQPKNANRRDAITNGEYLQIESESEVAQMFDDILEKQLKNELQKRQSEA
mgnify:CR=1 FL=1